MMALDPSKEVGIWAKIVLEYQHERLDANLASLDNALVPLLELFIKGFEMMIPYRSRLRSLHISTGSPELLRHAMRFLSAPLAAPFDQTYSLRIDHQFHLQTDISRARVLFPSLLDDINPRSNEAEGRQFFYDLSSQFGLESLDLSGSLHPLMRRRALGLPSNITSLTLPDHNAQAIIGMLTQVSRTLRSFRIVTRKREGSERSLLLPTADDSTSVPFIILPSLYALSLSRPSYVWPGDILDKLSFPRLEKVTLHGMDEVLGLQHDPRRKKATYEANSHKRSLITLELKEMTICSPTLYCIEYFAGPVHKLVIENVQVAWPSQSFAEVREAEDKKLSKEIQEILARVRPTVIEAKNTDVYNMMIFLRHLDLGSLERVWMHSIKENRSEVFDKEIGRFSAPLLQHISFSETDNDDRELILGHLDRPDVTKVEVIE